MSASVAILCARADSIYKQIDGCDVYDEARNAFNYAGGSPVVAHVPCRLFGRLREFANAPDPTTEKMLAHFGVGQVREWGGVLEHPINSLLWSEAKLPRPGERDMHGGFTVALAQSWFGHRAEKWSWFYVCGCEPKDLPEIPFVIGEASHVIAQSKGRQKEKARPEVTKSEREATPRALAEWLVETARRCAGVTA